MIAKFFNDFFSKLSAIPHDTLMWIIWGSFAGLFLLAFISCILSNSIKSASKRPFLCLVNAYTAVTLAGFMTLGELAPAILASALFWCAGYLLYGVLCLVSKPAKKAVSSQIALASAPPSQPPAIPPVRHDMPPAKTSVRLDHAISVTDKLLGKNLGKSDRQELEKLKNNLAVLQMKGNLSTVESDILNDNFNALLKLMAKYNV